jgi:hypothetical protein
MSTQDIVVLVAAVAIFGGLGLVALYSNRPEKKEEGEGKGSK